MARSLKKGPYVFERLLKKVKELNASGKKEVIKTWSRRKQFILILLDTHLRFIMVENLFLYM